MNNKALVGDFLDLLKLAVCLVFVGFIVTVVLGQLLGFDTLGFLAQGLGFMTGSNVGVTP